MSFSGSDQVKIVMGVDPGLSGGLGVLLGDTAIIYPVPIITSKVKKKTKGRGMHEVTARDFDLEKMYSILKQFQGNSVLFCIERVMATKQDSSYSMFSFGEGVGFWKMGAIACGFKLVQVTSPVWKKFYPEMLDSPEINSLRESSKALRAQLKLIKDKAQKNRIMKDMASVNREIKGHAKDAARSLAAKLYPDVAESFKLKKDDGKAEAILIARYAKATYNEG